MTVLKAGFLGSGRFGSGVVVARLSDGSWSAPSAIATGGAGFGGQIGFELTDFVFILNDSNAVKSFAQAGSITLGGNVSIAAGPVGRNAEAAGSASLKSVSGIFAYSKTKGLFAGVSLEGSIIVERRDANEKMYNSRITARQLLGGGVRPPPEADPLMRVLNSRVFAGTGYNGQDAMYNDIPIYDDAYSDTGGRSPGGARSSVASPPPDYEYRDRPSRANTWNDDVYDRDNQFNASNTGVPSRSFSTRANPAETFESITSRRNTIHDQFNDGTSKPARPLAPKPTFKPKPTVGQGQAVALYTFDAAQAGDLGFKKGEVITIVKRTESETDWWTGRIGDREGIFPRWVLLMRGCFFFGFFGFLDREQGLFWVWI